MALDPWFAVYLYDEYTKNLQTEAISDIMAINPREKHTGLGTYGLSPPCRAVVWAVLRGMNGPLSSWSAKSNVIIHDLHKPWFKPEAFRLKTGSGLWPTPGRIVVLMPLSTGTANIELMPRGTNYCIPAEWEPGMVLFLNETGIRFTGNGCLRFIYIILHKSPLPQKKKYRFRYYRR
ncbi:hypothetical protein NW754_015600 [Fusarium falciforme]|nr:hypothetical protein NW754_015600 [Fusarium falciforme]KAJ4201035.1 hypothetical protein NW767_007171 [Fusarium falciforme]